MTAAGFELPKDKRLWLVGGAIAAAVVASGLLKGKGAGNPAGLSISPADLLDAIRVSSSAASGAAQAGISAGGSIGVAGLGEGGRIADSALALAGRVVDDQSRVTETAIGSLSRGFDSTLTVLQQLAAGRPGRSSNTQPVGGQPPPPSPAPVPQPVRVIGVQSPAPTTTPKIKVSYDSPAPSAFAQKVGADAQSANLSGLLFAPLTYKLVTGEYVTLG